MDEDVAPVFKLVDLVKLYSARLQQFGIEQDTRPHSTDLKNRILAHFPDLKAYKEGRDVLLGFDRDMGAALRKLCKDDFDDEPFVSHEQPKLCEKTCFNCRLHSQAPLMSHVRSTLYPNDF